MSPRLQNYLKTYRKQSGFSQEEIAFLLGSQSGAIVSRYELLKREPNLRCAFVCQVIFGIPANEIFPGIFAEVEQLTHERSKLLYQKLEDSPATPLIRRKISILNKITSEKEIEPQQNL